MTQNKKQKTKKSKICDSTLGNPSHNANRTGKWGGWEDGERRGERRILV
jgi:hypothetical protein